MKDFVKDQDRRVFMLLGGFLGAGKTSCVRQLVAALNARGLVPGVVTNDQGGGLIDSQLATDSGATVEEITGGYFCCQEQRLSHVTSAAIARTEDKNGRRQFGML
jgi:G3E family GTPase